MLFIIRSNSLFNYFLLLALTVVIRMPGFFQFQHLDLQPYFQSSWLDAHLYGSSSLWLWSQLVLSSLITFGSALVVNHWMVSNKLIDRSGYLAAYCYVLVASALPVFQLVNAESICALVLLLLCGKLIRFIRQEEKSGDVFDMGLLAGLMTIIYQPALICLLFLFIALNSMKILRMRDYLVLVSGYICPLFICFTALYLSDQLPSALLILKSYFAAYRFHMGITPSQIFISILFGGLTLAAMVKFQNDYNKSVVSFRKLITVLFYMFLFVAAGILLNRALSGPHFILFCIPVSVFMAYILKDIKSIWWSEGLNAAILLTVFVSNIIFKG